MAVAGEEDQAVLDDQGSDPEVVGGDGCAGAAKLGEDVGVDVGRLLVGQQDRHAIGLEELGENGLVGFGPAAVAETGPQLGQHDDGNEDLAGAADARDGLIYTAHEIHVAVDVDGDLQCHASGSTMSCSATASSKAGSSCQVPMR